MRLAVLEIQMGCYIDVMTALWPDYIEALALIEL